MNVLVILSSIRNKNTLLIIKKFENTFKSLCNIQTNFEYIELKNYNLKTCLGCGSCKVNQICCIKDDDGDKINQKLFKADLIILSTPVYSFRESSLLKNFIERFHYYYFYPQFFKKLSLVFVTGSVAGENKVQSYLEFNLVGWGTKFCGKIGVLMSKYRTNKNYIIQIDKKINRIIKKVLSLKSNRKIWKPNIIQIYWYYQQKKLIKAMRKFYKEPYLYWRKNNLLNQFYF